MRWTSKCNMCLIFIMYTVGSLIEFFFLSIFNVTHKYFNLFEGQNCANIVTSKMYE